ncbi:MAG: PHP domain-containing protein, partial [Chloroflexota bacterium]|nr:PHP domain-containing protein [Chloroflexota bacterium]
MYTELHLHTSFSFLDGASQPDELIRRAQELGYTALAITDHDGLHGALEFAQLAEEAGIQPITGAEITLADGSHLTLLAETPAGYANLCRVLTHIHHGRHPAPVALSDSPGPSLDNPQLNPPLGDYAEGIILLTGCRKGQLSRVVDDDNMRDASQVLDQYIAWFGYDNVFVELQQNEVFGDTARIRTLVDLANAAGVGCVATSNVHYHAAARHRLQDVLVAIHSHTTLDGCHRERRPNARFALPTHAEMERRFAEWPEAIANTQVIARRCEAFRITRDLRYTFPNYDASTGETPDETLARICWETFPQRYSEDNHRAREQIREELRLISRHNLAGFFLIYRDLLELAREVAAELRGGPISG